MISLRNIRRPSKKPLLILAGIVLAAVVLCGGGWWYNAGQAAAAYAQQRGEHMTKSRNELKAIADGFKALTQQGDSKKSLETLAALQAALDRQISGAPSLPQLFGVTLTPAEASQKRDIYIDRLTRLKKSVAAAREYMAYQQATAAMLQEVATRTGPNAEQQKALADAWGAMIGKLRALTPPADAASAHQQIVDAATAVHGALAGMPDLFTKKDIAGFAARQKEAEAHVNTLRSLGEGVRVLAITLDKNIARDWAALNDAMN